MRPLHGLILLLALVALLVGGLFWLSRSGSAGTLDPARAEAPVAPAAPVAELSATDSEAAKAERAAQPAALVKIEGAEAAADTSNGLFGRVVGADGKGVPGAKVYAAPAEGPAFMSLDAIDPKTMPWAKRSDAVTDAEGRFALALANQTHVRLAVRAGGFAPLDAERTLARGGRDLGDVALEPGVVLEGKVVDQLGRPVAEAQLFSRPRNAGFGIEMMGRGRNPLATTDGEGRFRIDMLASGPWRMLVSSEEHPDKTFDGESERPGALTSNLKFALEEGAQIAGRVTGASGEIVAKLQVNAQQRAENEEGGEGMFFGPGGFTAPRKAKVGADGSFVVRGLKPNQNYKLDAQKADSGFYGFGMNTRTGVNAKSGDRGIEVPYTASPAIVCQVVDAASGKPVTEMDVKAGYGWMMPLMDADGKSKSSFPDGNVRFDRLPPRFGGGGSGLKLRIDATGYKSYESAELTQVAGQDLDLGVVRLERAPVCRVQVLELATGQPLAGAEVSLREESAEGGQPSFGRSVSVRRGSGGRTVNEQGSSQGVTGADGTVVLSSFPGKKATLKVKHEDFAGWRSSLTLAESSDHQETVKLARGGEVLVSVRDAQDRPVPGVEIEHAGPGGEPGNPFERRFGGGSTRSDARGELVFNHLEAGTHRFRVATEGGGMRMFGGGAVSATLVLDGSSGQADPPQEEPWADVEVTEGAAAPLKLVAPMRGSLVGRVREGGKALAGASVRLEEKKQGGGEGGFMDMPFFGAGEGPRTNGSGEYKCEGVKPGKYTMHLTHPSRAMPWETDLEVGEGEQRFDIELPIAIVEGRITGPDGKPVVGARITAERKQEKSESREMVFSFAIAGDEGDAMTFGGSGGGEAQRTDADGRYTLRGVLTDADLVVHVTHKEYKPTNSEKFRCSQDQTVRGIDVKLSQGGILEVRVLRNGKPASGVLVNAYHKAKDGSEDNHQTEFSGPAGVARFTGLEPGDWEFTVVDVATAGELGTPPPEGPRRQVELAAGVTTKVDHDLP